MLAENARPSERAGHSFQEVVRLRTSYRKFLPKPVPADVINAVLDDAQQAPSNSNTQPWVTHIVTGAKLQELSAAILAANAAGHHTPDFSFAMSDFRGRFQERAQEEGKHYYGSLGVAREDEAGRRAAAELNYTFFGAPQAAFLFMPSVGDNVRVAGDVGMYGQTFLLSLTDHGLGGVPQTALGYFAATIREVLHVPAELKLLFGISFGYVDPTALHYYRESRRDPLTNSVVFHS